MTTLRALDAQQVKWNFGAIDLLWPGQRGDTRGQPFHPNLRLRWFEHFSMVAQHPVPARLPAAAGRLAVHPRLRLRPALADPAGHRDPAELPPRAGHGVATSATTSSRVLFFPAELYMWIRMGHFVSAWTKFFAQQTDNWAAQANAERGKGSAYLYPFLSLIVFLITVSAIWLQLPLGLQSNLLEVGYPILGVITIVQTAWMSLKALRRYRGFRHEQVRRKAPRGRGGGRGPGFTAGGCSALDSKDGPSGPAASSDASAAAVTFDSQFTRDGTFQSHVGCPRRRTWTSSTRSTRPSRHHGPTSGTRRGQFFSFTFQAYDLAQKLRAPFATKRKVWLSHVMISSATIMSSGAATEGRTRSTSRHLARRSTRSR